ncbi:MAG: PIN domain-containing protein [Chitinophagales bacterium]
MNIIVDANIVFSGILNTNGKIGTILINSQNRFTFIAPDFLRKEIRKHYPKLIKISGLTTEQITETEFLVCRQINFISEEQIKAAHWVAAEKLVADIDPKDTHYVAYAKQFRCKIWSGDKVLMRGLEKKGFHNFITTNELYKLLEKE